MEDERKTKEKLMEELIELRKKNERLEAAIKELKQAGDKLRESKEMLQSLFDGIPAGLYRSTLDGKVMDSNPALWKMLGYPDLKAVIKDNVAQNYVNPEDRRRWQTLIDRDGVVTGFEVQWRRKDGKVIWVSESARLVRDKSGRGLYYEGSVEEITERKKAEQEKRESEEKFRALFEGAAEGILVADIESRKFLYANPAICQMLGYTEMELKSMGMADIHPKDSLKHVISEFEAQARGEKILAKNIPCLRKDGTVIYADVKRSQVLIERKKCNVGFFTDVTDHKRAEEAVKESEEKYRAIFESLQDVYYRTDKKGLITIISPSVRARAGYDPEEIISHPVTDFYFNPEDRETFLPKLKEKGAVTNYELELKAKDGSVIETSINAHIIFGKDGEPTGIEGMLHDITELKKAERQIKKSLEEKEVLLKEIHHRVKNNMQIISSLLRLQAANVKDEKILEVFDEIHGRIRSMSLLYEMLYQSKDLARVDFSEYIKRLTGHLISMHQPKVTVPSLRIGVSDVHLDIKRAIPCGLIITELMSNSLKHAFPNGRKGEITVEMHPHKGEKYKLVVSDNGVGFPQGLDFRQTKSLGMRLVVDLVKQLNGTIELRREKGTEFRIEF
jgi:PAS domain S-box-containing protein